MPKRLCARDTRSVPQFYGHCFTSLLGWMYAHRCCWRSMRLRSTYPEVGLETAALGSVFWFVRPFFETARRQFSPDRRGFLSRKSMACAATAILSGHVSRGADLDCKTAECCFRFQGVLRCFYTTVTCAVTTAILRGHVPRGVEPDRKTAECLFGSFSILRARPRDCYLVLCSNNVSFLPSAGWHDVRTHP